ncbi:MAG: DUF3810 domain-containing protein [Cyclobacteriaceae bacterium]
MGLKEWLGFYLGVSAIILRELFIAFPEMTEKWYSRGFFPLVRVSIDHTLALFPFPTVYLFFLGLLVFIYLIVLACVKRPNLKSKVGYLFRAFSNFLGSLVFMFLVLWGFNYQRIPVFQQLSLQPQPMELPVLIQEMNDTHDVLLELRCQLQVDTAELQFNFSSREWMEKVSDQMEREMPLLGFRYDGAPRVKAFFPPGFMRKMGIYGIYFPFTGEGYLDPTLHPLEKPFTMAHEMAHGCGISDEGEANFISWIICSKSQDPWLQYVGQLKLFRYQMNDLYRMDGKGYEDFVKRMDLGVKNDIRAILANNLAHPPMFLKLSKMSNDLYLKSQGVKAGIKSYTQLPMLAHAWKMKSLKN